MNERTLQQWFEAALDQDELARQAWLERECTDERVRRQVKALLAAHADTHAHVIDRPAADLVRRISDDLAGADVDRLVGTRVGPFRLQRLIGQGGMAVVFLAEREDVDFAQRVAVKLLRLGLFSAAEQRLFRRERKALATLSHPHIAQLIDGGVTESGGAYLAMEYVDGQPLTVYCREHRLDLRARLNLFVTVCRAVDAAHRALIVHRDIKPSNILVSNDGNVKLIDFGIAKLLEGDSEAATQTNVSPLTPEYAAPEQFDGRPITTATDVHALGVLLHELLTGARPPRNADSLPSQRVAQSRDEADTLLIPAVSLRRQLKGDLDNIIVKATEGEPTRRYADAGVLADDVERHLQGLPVHAHPPSGWYRTRKFVQRHRGSVAITALLVVGVLVSLVLALWQTDVARKEALRANAVRDFLIGALNAGRSEVPSDQRMSLGDLVAAARRNIDADTSLDSVTRTEVESTLAEVSWSAGDLKLAEALFSRVIGARTALAGPNDQRLAELHARLAELQIDSGDHRAAAATIARIPESAYQLEQDTALQIGLVRAMTRLVNGERDLALGDLPRIVRLADNVFGANSRLALETRLSAGGIYTYAHAGQEANTLLQPAVAQWQAQGLPENAFFATALSNLASTDVGDPVSNTAILRQALQLRQRIFGDPHPDIANAMNNLAVQLSGSGAIDEARSLHEQALSMRRKLFGADSTKLLSSLAGLAQVERAQRQLDAALAYIQEAERICRIGDNMRLPLCPRILHNVAYAHYQLKHYDAAEQAAQEELALLGGETPDNPDSATAVSLLATIASGAKRYDIALERVERALRMMASDPNTGVENLMLTRMQRGEILIGLRRFDEALRELDGVAADWAKNLSPNHFRMVSIQAFRVRAQLGLEAHGDARTTARNALALGVDTRLIKAETLDFLRRVSNGEAP